MLIAVFVAHQRHKSPVFLFVDLFRSRRNGGQTGGKAYPHTVAPVFCLAVAMTFRFSRISAFWASLE